MYGGGGGHLDLANDGRYFPSRRVTSPIYKSILCCRDENIGLLGVVITHCLLLQYWAISVVKTVRNYRYNLKPKLCSFNRSKMPQMEILLSPPPPLNHTKKWFYKKIRFLYVGLHNDIF